MITMNKPFKKLIIIGAGGFGREVYAWAKQSKETGSLWKIKGFLDDNKNALAGYKYDVGIISGIEKYIPKAEDLFVCAIGNPKLKKKITSIILKKGGLFANVIHPTVVLGENVRLGIGIILCPYAVIDSDSVLGDFVTVNLHSHIGHDAKIGNWCEIGPSCAINGKVTLEKSVFIGSHGVILPGSSVGEGAIVGAGSVAIGNVKSHVTVFGIPAKPLPFSKR